MPNTNHLFRLLTEIAFLLVGALLLWVGWMGRFIFFPQQLTWRVITAILVLWGLRTWRQARRRPTAGERAAERIGGGSVALAGLILLSLGWMPFRLTGWLLAAVGGIFVLRGLVTAAIMARSS